MVEMWEMSDELEFLLPGTSCPEGLREGKAGDTCDWELRDGKGGGGRVAVRVGTWTGVEGDGLPRAVSSSVFLRGSGGAFSAAGLIGRGGIDGVGVSSPIASCVIVAIVDSVAARFGGGGGGARLPALGGGAWKFFCLFNAAIRSLSELNCGSSTSAMFFERVMVFDVRKREKEWRRRGVAIPVPPTLLTSINPLQPGKDGRSW